MEKEQPIEEKYREQMRDLGRLIDQYFNPDGVKVTGFALLVFPFGSGDDHRSNYISNANREDMLATMKEFIARAEGRHHENRPSNRKI